MLLCIRQKDMLLCINLILFQSGCGKCGQKFRVANGDFPINVTKFYFETKVLFQKMLIKALKSGGSSGKIIHGQLGVSEVTQLSGFEWHSSGLAMQTNMN